MSPLAGALLDVLLAEAQYPPLSAAKLAEVLRVTGQACEPGHPSTERIELALEELLVAGQAERIWRRGAASYRALSRPEPDGATPSVMPCPRE